MEWFENDDFWRTLYPYMFPPTRFDAAAKEVDAVQQLAQVSAGTVLDLCCGPGRHSVEFAQRGFHVTGVDASPFLLTRARERAAEAHAHVEWVHDDMRRFRRPSAFDLACSLFTSFGYFDSDDDNLLAARNIYENLKPGGILVLEAIGKERLARLWKDSIVTDFPDGALLIQLPRISHDWTRISNRWLVVKDGTARTFLFEHTIYSGEELRNILLRARFESVELFGSLGGTPYGLDAERLVAVARKAESR